VCSNTYRSDILPASKRRLVSESVAIGIHRLGEIGMNKTPFQIHSTIVWLWWGRPQNINAVLSKPVPGQQKSQIQAAWMTALFVKVSPFAGSPAPVCRVKRQPTAPAPNVPCADGRSRGDEDGPETGVEEKGGGKPQWRSKFRMWLRLPRALALRPALFWWKGPVELCPCLCGHFKLCSWRMWNRDLCCASAVTCSPLALFSSSTQFPASACCLSVGLVERFNRHFKVESSHGWSIAFTAMPAVYFPDSQRAIQASYCFTFAFASLTQPQGQREGRYVNFPICVQSLYLSIICATTNIPPSDETNAAMPRNINHQFLYKIQKKCR